jgi:hypothetical protein
MSKSEILETRLLLEQAQNKINEANKKYYKDVLDFLNMLFETDEKSILKIKIKKMSLNTNIIETYNYIIKKHKLKKNMLDVEAFDFSIDYEQEDVLKVCLTICNNLLEKINYKMIVKNYNNKKSIRIKTLD